MFERAFMNRFASLLLLLSLASCVPTTSVTSARATVGKIDSFEVTVISSTENSATVGIDFKISVPTDKRYEANVIIKAPNVPDPFFIALSDRFAEIQQVRLTGWKDNNLSGQFLMKDGQILSGEISKIPNLFNPPQTSYDFELFIRPVDEGIATATEKRILTIK
jgi:hypothetical protein